MNCTVIALLRVTLMNFVEIHKKMCDKIKTFHTYATDVLQAINVQNMFKQKNLSSVFGSNQSH